MKTIDIDMKSLVGLCSQELNFLDRELLQTSRPRLCRKCRDEADTWEVVS